VEGTSSVEVERDFEITINGKVFVVKSKHMTGAEIKKLAAIPPCDVLNKVEGGKLIPIRDDEKVTIKEHEKFVSHPGDCGSSCE